MPLSATLGKVPGRLYKLAHGPLGRPGGDVRNATIEIELLELSLEAFKVCSELKCSAEENGFLNVSAADAFSLLSESSTTLSSPKGVPWSTPAGATQSASYKNLIAVSLCAAVSHSVESWTRSHLD